MKKKKKSEAKKPTPKQRAIRRREMHIARLEEKKDMLYEYYLDDVKKIEMKIKWLKFVLAAAKKGKL